MTKARLRQPTPPHILTVNGGSSSIKFALFAAGDALTRILEGSIEGIGESAATMQVKGLQPVDNFLRSVTAPDHTGADHKVTDHTVAVGTLMDWIEERSGRDGLTAVGHRVVHGGPDYSAPQRITPAMVEALQQLSPFDPQHLPEEIQLTEAFQRRFPDLLQVACFEPHFITICRAWRACCQFRAAMKHRGAPLWLSRLVLCLSHGRTGPLGWANRSPRSRDSRPSWQWR